MITSCGNKSYYHYYYRRLIIHTFVLLPSIWMIMMTLQQKQQQSGSYSSNNINNILRKTTTNTNMIVVQSFRIELLFTNKDELQKRIQFLTNYKLQTNRQEQQEQQQIIHSFNLVNKNRKDTMNEWVNCIKEIEPNSNICAHYSLKYNKVPRKGKVAHQQQLIQFWNTCNADEILFVSGSGELKKQQEKSPADTWTTIQALQTIQRQQQQIQQNIQQRDHQKDSNNNNNNNKTKIVAVAYNPYFPNEKEQKLEDKRLEEKLQTGIVSKVYLQFGTDLNRLKQALIKLSKLKIKNNIITQERDGGSSEQTTTLQIAGSIFLPTARLLQQQKFRPWNGVFLNDEFLSNPINAKQIVIEIMKLYSTYNVEFLFEAPGIRTEKDMMLVQELLNDSSRSISSRILHKEITATTTNDDDENNNNNGKEEEKEEEKYVETSITSTSTDTNKKNLIVNPYFKNKSKVVTTTTTTTTTNVVNKKQQQQQQNKKKSKSNFPCIILFGSHDVRIRDNKALECATEFHNVIIPIFLWNVNQGQWGVPGALQVVLKDALLSLEKTLQEFDIPLLCINYSDSDSDNNNNNCLLYGMNELKQIMKETNTKTIVWNREHTPEGTIMEQYRLKELKKMDGITVIEKQSSLLYDPKQIQLQSGFNGGHWGTLMPFLKYCKKTFGIPNRPTLYSKTFQSLQDVKGINTLNNNNINHATTTTNTVNNLQMAIINGNDKWDKPILNRFSPISEEHALQVLHEFITIKNSGLSRYEKDRNRSDKDEYTTSKLSVHLRIGTLSPNELYWKIEDCNYNYDVTKTFARKLFWRDLAYYQLECFPHMRTIPIRKHYEKLQWASKNGGYGDGELISMNEEEQRRYIAWKLGKTGYPIVDAGMRELYKTGYMTQSIRMVVASFLVEYLRVNWIKGCNWFHYTLIDCDSAINSMMWQNAGKCGIDQWNFILSPISGSSKDPTGEYIKKWIPELSLLPTSTLLHRPWEASQDLLNDCNIELGITYPNRIIIDLQKERQLSIDDTIQMRKQSQEYNTEEGYDLITLPNGLKTVVFTKKEYRINKNGERLYPSSSSSRDNTNSRSNSPRKKQKQKQKQTSRKRGTAKALQTTPTAMKQQKITTYTTTHK